MKEPQPRRVPPPRPPVTPSGVAGLAGPPLPDRNKLKLSRETKQWQLSPRALIDPPASTTKPSPAVSLYKAVFEYKASQGDELSLKKGELYEVAEKCHDGWFKGKHINTGNVGVCRNN